MKLIYYILCTGAALSLVTTSCHKSTVEEGPMKYEKSTFYCERTSLFDSLPVDSNDIIMLGNSLINRCEWHELFDNPNVKNRGIEGDIIEGVKDRLDPILKGKPHKIFLMMGFNNINQNYSVDSVVCSYKQLISNIRVKIPETQLFVQSILPVRKELLYWDGTDKDKQICEVNTRVSAMSDSLGFTWINLYDEFTDADGSLKTEYTNDGVHLLAPGYLKWRDCLLPYISD